MSLSELYIIISIVVSTWGITIAIFFVMNSFLKRILLRIDRLDINQIEPQKPKYIYFLFKRLFDILFSLFLLIYLSPLFVVIAISIKITSRGPVFIIKRERIGLNGRIIYTTKFRTMYIQDESSDKQFLDFKDPRITKVGRMLRATTLDEFPSLINVLKGDMSIIGRSRILDYSNIDSGVKTETKKWLFSIKPGLISLWTVSYDRIRVEPKKILMYDLTYLSRMSFSFDLMIIIRAIIMMLGATAGY